MPDTQARAAIQAAIKAIIQTVPGLDGDRVFDGRLFTVDPDTYRAKFYDENGHIQAWFISRRATPTIDSEMERGQIPLRSSILRRHTFDIEGFLGIEFGDEHDSEDQFQLLLDDFLTTFNELRTLSSTAWNSHPPQLRVVDFATLGTVTCHHAMLEITAMEWVNGLEPH